MPASARREIIVLSVPDSLLKGADNEKLVRHVRTLNPTAKSSLPPTCFPMWTISTAPAPIT